MAFPDRLAVPARALAVLVAVSLLVCLAGPGESVVQRGLSDFVVVVDVLSCLVDDVFHVARGVQLVSVPGEVDVEGGHGHVGRIIHEGDEALVLHDESRHGRGQSWGVQPVDVVHLLDEAALSYDSSNEVDCERRRVLPVAAHHLAESDALQA